VLAAMRKVTRKVSSGAITAGEGAEFAKIFDLCLQTLGHVELEQRLRHVAQMAGTARSLPSLPKPVLDS
jgi:hypothetical protein